jgi:copper chaperone CopZ
MKQLLLALAMFFSIVHTANAESKTATIHIKASIYCDHCKECESCGKRLEEAVYSQKGVKRVDINEEAKTIKIVYNTTKTSTDKLKQAIAAVGFDADEVKADPKAYEKLDPCCKKN